jgi:outer membrane protein TolC
MKELSWKDKMKARYYVIVIFNLTMLFAQQAFSSGRECECQVSELSLDFFSASAMGVANSFELQEIRARGALYDFSVYEKLREFFPSLTFSYLQTEDVRRRENDDRQTRLTVETEIPVYNGGRRELNYDIAKLNALLARNDYRISMNRLIAQIRGEYLELLKLREIIEIHKKTLEHGEMQLTFVRKEFELGDATRLAVMEIEAKIREIELSLKNASDEYQDALKKFKLTLKIHWRTPVVIKGDIEKDFMIIPVSGLDDEELISVAIRMRKEIESSEAEYEISLRNNNINERYFIPNISMGFNYNLTGEDFPPREKGWGVNFKISSQLYGNSFSGGSGYNESGNGNGRGVSRNASITVLDNMPYKRSLVESRIEMARCRDERLTAKETISIEVAASCSSLRNSWDMIEIAGRRLELYDSQLEIERLKANMGEARRFDLVEKEIERGEAAVALLNSRIRYLLAASSLELAVGMDSDFLKKYLMNKNEEK